MSTSIRGAMPLRQVDSGPSRLLWKDCPWDDIGNSVRGTKFYEDFSGYPSWAAATDPTLVAATAINPLKYATYYDTADVISQASDQVFGALAMVTAATDKNEVWQQPGGGSGGSFVLIDPATGTNPHDVWFEARFKISSIGDDLISLFIGLGEEGMAVANTKVDDTGVMADKDFIGFNTLNADGDLLEFTYKKNGQTVQVPIAIAATLVADTFITVGWHYLSNNPTAKRVTVFVDNVIQATGVTKANIEAVTFPDGEEMAPLWGHKNGAATAGTLTIPWIRCAIVEN